MHVAATAGHVDHGKSTLVRALTGIDPDRLEEEKRRGLTIDLGFAWLKLPSGREIGLVDVPGHERFIKNMLAGVGAINVTLFTVAANEGWKPQSQEHLDILDLLGVAAGVIAVTKADVVEAEELERVVADVRKRISATTLAGSAIVAVSAMTGAGIETLLKEIDTVLDHAPAAEDLDRPRLWIDRVFSMKGAGTVVTGTLIGGSLEQNQEIEILPEGTRARVRSIQSHRRQVERIGPGNRTALNLVGIDPQSLTRGDAISRPGLWRPTKSLVASLTFVHHLGFEPTERGAFKFHVGSAERDAEIYFLDPSQSVTDGRFALLALDQPIVCDWQDRFVLREAGRRMTIGGGTVLEPHPATARRRDFLLLEGARLRAAARDRAGYFRILLEEEGSLVRRDIRIRTGLSPDQLPEVGAVWLDKRVFANKKFEQYERALVAALAEHHSNHPLEAGIPRESMRTQLALDPSEFDEIVDELSRRGRIVADENFLRTNEHVPAVAGPETDALIEEIVAGGASPPTLGELESRFNPALIRALVRARELFQISPDIVYPAGWIQDLKSQIADHIATKGGFTVAEFRDLIGTTRKYAVPLLEYLDQIGFTRRQGDTRVLGPKA